MDIHTYRYVYVYLFVYMYVYIHVYCLVYAHVHTDTFQIYDIMVHGFLMSPDLVALGTHAGRDATPPATQEPTGTMSGCTAYTRARPPSIDLPVLHAELGAMHQSSQVRP